MWKYLSKVNMKSFLISLLLLYIIVTPISAAESGSVENSEVKKSFIQKIADILFTGDGSSSSSDPSTDQGSTTTGQGGAAPSIYPTFSMPPDISSADESEYANVITNLAYQDCTSEGKGIMTEKNIIILPRMNGTPSCIRNIKEVMNPDGVSKIINSVDAYYYIQCVACAHMMAAARGRPYNGGGNAKDHIGQQIAGYTYVPNDPDNYDQLIPGSIGISNEGTYGHIYYITEVYKEVDSYKALECNYGAKGYIRHDLTRTLDYKSKSGLLYLAGWHRPN